MFSGVFIFAVFAVNVLKSFYCVVISSSITDVFCAQTLIYSALFVVLMSKELLPAFYCSSDVLYAYNGFLLYRAAFSAVYILIHTGICIKGMVLSL